MFNFNKIQSHARWLGAGVAAVAAAALVACGGGGGEDTSGREVAYQVATNAVEPSAPGDTSTRGVVPVRYVAQEDNISLVSPLAPPRSCQQFFPGSKEYIVVPAWNGSPQFMANTDNTWTSVSAPPSFLTTTLNTPNSMSWTATDTPTTDYQVVGVIIKADSRTHVYSYPTGNAFTSDSNLNGPEAGQTTGIFWYHVCYVSKPIVQGPPQWCSPGYWKNHTDAWVPTGYKTSTLYSSVTPALPALSPKTSGKDCSSLPASPTLFDVISMPQCYGGPAANDIADLLSKAHPNVNFTGERIENCPLN